MSEHRPKSAALGAYAEGQLSAEGRARVERHLAECELCRRELAAVRAYRAMTFAARTTPPPDLDFARLERRLAEEAQRISGENALRTRRPVWPLAIGLAAAAGLGALYLAWPSAPPAQVDRQPPAAPLEEPEPAALSPVVTLAAGTALAFGDEAGRALEPGAALMEGERLETGDDGLVHVRLADGTGLVLGPSSALTLSRARQEEVTLSLARGRVTSLVAPLAEGARYEVRAGDHTVAVRGTRFSVARLERGLEVDVAEGRVEVRGSDEVLGLTAPARWRSDAGPHPERGEGPHGELTRGLPTPRHTGAPGEWTLVRLEHPELVRWEVDGTPIASAGPVRLWLSAGEHGLRGWDAGGRLFSAELPVGREPVVLAPEALRPERARLRPGHLPEGDIAPVVQRGRPQLARCFERALRVHDEVGGQVRLRVTVGRMGEVSRVQVLGADAPELRECVSRYVSRWSFPPPGGPVTFEVPLAFSARL